MKNNPPSASPRSYRYRGHLIVVKRDHGLNPPANLGWVVCDKNGFCNVARVATWFHSLRSARRAVDVLIAIGGERRSDLFWEVIQPNTWKVGQKMDDYGTCDGHARHGRYTAVVKAGVITQVCVKQIHAPEEVIVALRRLGVVLPDLVARHVGGAQ